MKLLDKDKKAVPGAWNDVTREFQVDLAAPSDAHAHAHAPPAPPPAASGSAAPALPRVKKQ